MAGFFFTGEETAALTPKSIERRRALLDALGKDAYSTAPVGHWTQGAARLVNALANNFEENRLNKAEKKGTDDASAAILAALGMGPAGASPAAAPEAAGGVASPFAASPDVPRETLPPSPIPQQPLMPNRPQMPVSSPVAAALVKGDVAAGASADAGPSPFGSLAQPNQPPPANPQPLWTQPGMTKGLAGVGQMPVNPSMAFAAPGPMVPMGGGAPQMANGGGQWQRMIQQESGGRQLRADGSPVTSSAGAIGIAQVMPQTGPEAARLAGLPWDPVRFRNDAQYNEALGKAYYQAQMRAFNDPTAAAAAYNAGPGRVNQAIARQERTGQPYTDFLPRETQDYIAKVAGPGDMPAPGAQEAQNLPRPAPGQFNIPVQQGAAPDRTAAIIRALSNPWAQQANPMLAGVAQKVLGEQLTGNKLQYQTLPDGTILALDPTGRRAPTPVYQAPVKPQWGVIGERDGEKQYGFIDLSKQLVNPYGGTTQNQPSQPVNIPGVGQVTPPQGKKAREAFDKKIGETTATAAIDAPKVIENGTNALAVLGKLESHPGLPRILGLMGKVPSTPGSNAADAEAILGQIKGKAFLQAFETLKGGGQITQVEGEKATEAIARLGQNQSEKAFRESLAELRGIMERGLANARARGQIPAPATTGQQQSSPKGPPKAGHIEDGYRFKGGNPADPKSWEKAQ